jgi:hypothetical protein
VGVSVTPDETPLVLNPAPVSVTPEIVIFEFPLFVSVTLSELLLPTLMFPNVRLVGLALSEYVAATPVPLNPIKRGEFGALLTSETEPLTAPAEVGEKTT